MNLRKKEENEDFGASLELDGENGGSEWVNCPVCGGQIRAGDEVINSHLGNLLLFFPCVSNAIS